MSTYLVHGRILERNGEQVTDAHLTMSNGSELPLPSLVIVEGYEKELEQKIKEFNDTIISFL